MIYLNACDNSKINILCIIKYIYLSNRIEVKQRWTVGQQWPIEGLH